MPADASASGAKLPSSLSAMASASLLPPQVEIEGTKRRILEAALPILADRSSFGCSIRDLATAVGIRSATLYDHFPSKDHITAQLVEIGNAALKDALTDAIDGAPPDDPREQVRAMVTRQVQLYGRYRLLAIVANDEIMRLPDDLAAPSWVLRRDAELLALDVINRGMQQGAFDVPNLAVAMAAIGSMIFRVPHWFVPREGLMVDDLAAHYGLLALRLLASPDPT